MASSSCKKLPDSLDNPIDTFIIDNIVTPINPYLYKLGFTPNMLTAISGLFGVASVCACYHSKYALCGLLYTISYIFDCFDGNFARCYNMVTEFGDWFDHVKDNLVVFCLIFVIYTKKDIPSNLKLQVIPILLIMGSLLGVYINDQEKYYNMYSSSKPSATLSIFKLSVTNKPPGENLKWSKYFGFGTFHILLVVILVLFEYKKIKV
jgi:phosphatidylglycerophosphate synthase